MVIPSILICNLEHHQHIDEEEIFKTSIARPQKLESSALVFTSPKKKDPKHRRRKIDVERQEERRKRRKESQTNKFRSEKQVEKVHAYGT